MAPCVRASIGDSDPDVDAQRNAIALVHMLNKCHHVCSCFAIAGFVLVVTGMVACFWGLLEPPVAIFGSVCISLCFILSFGALR
jgi:hypothetical protein